MASWEIRCRGFGIFQAISTLSLSETDWRAMLQVPFAILARSVLLATFPPVKDVTAGHIWTCFRFPSLYLLSDHVGRRTQEGFECSRPRPLRTSYRSDRWFWVRICTVSGCWRYSSDFSQSLCAELLITCAFQRMNLMIFSLFLTSIQYRFLVSLLTADSLIPLVPSSHCARSSIRLSTYASNSNGE